MMIGECDVGLGGIVQSIYPVILQQQNPGTTSGLGPVLAAGVGALAAIIAAILSFVAMTKASKVAVLNNATLLNDQHERFKREALSDLLALTYQPRTSDGDAAIVKAIARLQLLISPRDRAGRELLKHLDAISAKPDMFDWRQQLLRLARNELDEGAAGRKDDDRG
jgi:hypothetical protein